jgi:REP element-mobilizing transposase RayT
MMDDPIGFFLTWTTYGTWLPGDARGWVEYRHGWQLPDPVRELEAAAKMTEGACRLTEEQREAVEKQIGETCQHRGWRLCAVNCRSNHVHVVVSVANVRPKKIRVDLKAWATRCLKEQFDAARENWWAERGSIRHLRNDDDLEAAILYVTDGQERKPEA